MKKPLFKMLAMMVGIVGLTVGAGFALSNPASEADTVVVLQTAGMTCGSCAAKIDDALKGVSGVDNVQVDVENAKVLATFRSQAVKPEKIAETVTATGYKSSILAVLTMDQYKAAVSAPSQPAAGGKQGGCGGDCCNKKRN